MGLTACFLPKPVVGVNGSGMHTNVSISKNGKNLFWDPKGEEKLSKIGWAFVDRILTHGNDICLLLNPSVNAYRRLDPHFEAPNQIKASAVDRGSMIRIPIGNEKSMRVEVRSVAPDANPYMVHALDLQDRPRRRNREDQEPAPGRALSARQHLRRAGQLPKAGVDHQAARRRREGPLRRPEAGLRRPLPAPLGTFVKAPGSAVPPRGLQPVPLEPVLKLSSSAGYALASNPGHFSTPACERLTPASSIPKIAVRIHRHRIQLCKMSAQAPSRNLFRAIATDIHFWIPLVVLSVESSFWINSVECVAGQVRPALHAVPMQALRLRSLQALGIFCGFAAGAWLGGAEAPIKLVNPDISPITVSLIMVCGVFLARWSVPAFIRGTSHVSADVRQAPHLIVWAVLAGCMWAVANTLTIYAIRNVGLSIAFPLWNANSLLGIFWGVVLFRRITFRSLEALARGFRRRSIDVRGRNAARHRLIPPGRSGNRSPGIAAALGAGILWGTMYIPYRKAYLTGMNPLSFITFFTVGELITMIVLALSYRDGTVLWKELMGARDVLFWLMLGGFVWVIGDLFQQYATKYVGISRGIPLSNTNQLWGLLWGILVFHELRGGGRTLYAQVTGGSLLMALGAVAIALSSATEREHSSWRTQPTEKANATACMTNTFTQASKVGSFGNTSNSETAVGLDSDYRDDCTLCRPGIDGANTPDGHQFRLGVRSYRRHAYSGGDWRNGTMAYNPIPVTLLVVSRLSSLFALDVFSARYRRLATASKEILCNACSQRFALSSQR